MEKVARKNKSPSRPLERLSVESYRGYNATIFVCLDKTASIRFFSGDRFETWRPRKDDLNFPSLEKLDEFVEANRGPCDVETLGNILRQQLFFQLKFGRGRNGKHSYEAEYDASDWSQLGMRAKQEYKVVNTRNGTEVYFFSHSFESALYYAQLYMKRNEGKFPMALYKIDESANANDYWKKVA